MMMMKFLFQIINLIVQYINLTINVICVIVNNLFKEKLILINAVVVINLNNINIIQNNKKKRLNVIFFNLVFEEIK